MVCGRCVVCAGAVASAGVGVGAGAGASVVADDVYVWHTSWSSAAPAGFTLAPCLRSGAGSWCGGKMVCAGAGAGAGAGTDGLCGCGTGAGQVRVQLRLRLRQRMMYILYLLELGSTSRLNAGSLFEI